MAETFLTRIPTLSDSELEEYLRNYSRYELEAVEAALAELKRRGHGISGDEINAIRTSIHERDTGKSLHDPGPGNPEILNRCRMGRRQIRHIAVMILALGLGGAIKLRLAEIASPDERPNPARARRPRRGAAPQRTSPHSRRTPP